MTPYEPTWNRKPSAPQAVELEPLKRTRRAPRPKVPPLPAAKPGRADPIVAAYNVAPLVRCATCGVGYVPRPKSHGSRFCSDRCRILAFRDAHR